MGLGTTLRITLLDIRLQRSDLLVETCNILFDNVCEFLGADMSKLADSHRKDILTLISTGRSSNSVFRFATVALEQDITR